MVIRNNDRKREVKEKMRGGDGSVSFAHYDVEPNMKNCRLMAELVLEPGSSIGEHEHINETEYYIILEGTAVVVDEGKPVVVSAGDVVVTGHGGRHSIRNEGTKAMKMLAIIITHTHISK